MLTIHIFFFNDTATTEIYTLSLHDALPIYKNRQCDHDLHQREGALCPGFQEAHGRLPKVDHRVSHTRTLFVHSTRCRSEEHTSELQSPCNLVCRLLLEKKKNKIIHTYTINT